MTTDTNTRGHAITRLRELLAPGDTVYTVLRHVSRSGTTRSVSLLVVSNGEIVCIDAEVASVIDRELDTNHGGVKCTTRTALIASLTKHMEWPADAIKYRAL